LAYKATLDLSFVEANTSSLLRVVTSNSAGYLTRCLQESLGGELGNASLLEAGIAINTGGTIRVSALYDVPIVSAAEGVYIFTTFSMWGDCLQLLLSKELEAVVNVTYGSTIIVSSEPTDLPTLAPTASPVSSGKSIGAEIADVWWIIVIVVVICPILVCLLLKYVILKNDNPFIENPDLAYMKMEEFEEANASLNEAMASKKRTISFDRVSDRLTYAPVDELAEF